jgi:hypothetical protein
MPETSNYTVLQSLQIQVGSSHHISIQQSTDSLKIENHHPLVTGRVDGHHLARTEKK